MIESDSRSNYAPIVEIRDEAGQLLQPAFIGVRPRFRRSVSKDNYEVAANGSEWHKLGWRFLGHSKHWWAIADISGVVDPFTAFRQRTLTKFIGQLASNIVAGPATSVTMELRRGRAVKPGQTVTIRDLISGNTNTLTIEQVNGDVLRFPQKTLLVISAATSKVTVSYLEDRRLTVPSMQRLMFEFLDFGNPSNTVEE